MKSRVGPYSRQIVCSYYFILFALARVRASVDKARKRVSAKARILLQNAAAACYPLHFSVMMGDHFPRKNKGLRSENAVLAAVLLSVFIFRRTRLEFCWISCNYSYCLPYPIFILNAFADFSCSLAHLCVRHGLAR